MVAFLKKLFSGRSPVDFFLEDDARFAAFGATMVTLLRLGPDIGHDKRLLSRLPHEEIDKVFDWVRRYQHDQRKLVEDLVEARSERDEALKKLHAMGDLVYMLESIYEEGSEDVSEV